MSQRVAMQSEPIGLYPGLVAAYGFVPNLFQAQGALQPVIEAEERLIQSGVLHETRLSGQQKESLLGAVACARENVYCLTLYSASLEDDAPLLRFAVKLAKQAPWVSQHDIEALRNDGLDDIAILEAVATTALGQMLCTLADGLRPAIDSGLSPPVLKKLPDLAASLDWPETPGPYLSSQPPLAADFPPYAVLREQFGFIPNLYRAQSLLPQVLEAEVRLLESLLFPEDHLSCIQKEEILLVISAANLNTYCVAVHGQVLDALGIPLEQSGQIVENYHEAALSAADISLLDEVRKLAAMRPEPVQGRSYHPSRAGRQDASPPTIFDSSRLRHLGFTEPQIIEAVNMAALSNFLNTVQFGLGVVPDFPPRRVFGPKDLYRFWGNARLTSDAVSLDDPDAELVARVQQGETNAFEELVRRHTRRVFGTLAGLTGSMDDARDATQDVFLKAFEHIGSFEGRSKFSSWLTSIAVNTGTELLRQRKPPEPLENQEDESFRPLQIQSWTENPEQLFAASQMNALVREAVLRLPHKYRVAVLLRDINQLSTEDAAAALDLSIPALKARVLRGRLMLRESLAPHFIGKEKTVHDA
jgi:RNA polymerase sigma-70 factor, ECF subfamily